MSFDFATAVGRSSAMRFAARCSASTRSSITYLPFPLCRRRRKRLRTSSRPANDGVSSIDSRTAMSSAQDQRTRISPSYLTSRTLPRTRDGATRSGDPAGAARASLVRRLDPAQGPEAGDGDDDHDGTEDALTVPDPEPDAGERQRGEDHPGRAHHRRPTHRASIDTIGGLSGERRGWDSNPRSLAAQRLSRPPRSTAPEPRRGVASLRGGGDGRDDREGRARSLEGALLLPAYGHEELGARHGRVLVDRDDPVRERLRDGALELDGLVAGRLVGGAQKLARLEAADEVRRYLKRLAHRHQLGAVPRNAHFPLMPHVRTVRASGGARPTRMGELRSLFGQAPRMNAGRPEPHPGSSQGSRAPCGRRPRCR